MFTLLLPYLLCNRGDLLNPEVNIDDGLGFNLGVDDFVILEVIEGLLRLEPGRDGEATLESNIPYTVFLVALVGELRELYDDEVYL